MEEHASFEARAVLPPRRAHRARLALTLPAVALVAIAWAGVSGGRPDRTTAEAGVGATVADASLARPSLGVDGTPAVPSIPPAPLPRRVLGMEVQRLDAVDPGGHGTGDVVALTGWYVATSITDCPTLAAIFRDGALPELRPDLDELSFCVRSGRLYASNPNLREHRFSEGRAIPARFVIGVIAPLRLETIGPDPSEVVVLGRFVEGPPGCRALDRCRPELLIDHVAWIAGA